MPLWFNPTNLFLSRALAKEAKSQDRAANDCIKSPSSLYKILHKIVGVKEQAAKSVNEDDVVTFFRMVKANHKIPRMLENLEVFFEDYSNDEVFSEEEREHFNRYVNQGKTFDQRLTLFAQYLNQKLAQYFDVHNEVAQKRCPITGIKSKKQLNDLDFMGGLTNQIATTLSFVRVAKQLIDDAIKADKLQLADEADYKEALLDLTSNLKPMLYGFSKMQFSILRRLLNVLGHAGKAPPSKLFYKFKKKYFKLDDQADPKTLLPLKKLVRDFKWKTYSFPLFRDGLKFNFVGFFSKALGCPALAVKAPNGDNFIKVLHDFICDNLEKSFLPGLDDLIRLQ